MDNKKLIYVGGILAALGASLVVIRRLFPQYSNVSTIINSAMGNYFTIAELTYSDTAKAKNIKNEPNAQQKANLTSLINKVLNPIREQYGKPIKVSSGFRSETLNKIIGGASTSQHMLGQAADLVPTTGGSIADIFRAAVKCNNYDQLIIEHANGKVWVHVSWAPTLRKQMLAYRGGVYSVINEGNFERYL